MPLTASVETANLVNFWALVGGVVGATLTALSVGAIFWAAPIREGDAAARVEEAREKAATANEGLAKANAEIAAANLKIATAHAQAAQAEAKAAEAHLELERFKAPRNLAGAPLAAFLTIMRTAAGTHFDMAIQAGDPEAIDLARQISDALRSAGLVQVPWQGGDFVVEDPPRPTFGQVNAVGVQIQSHQAKADQFRAAGIALTEALRAGGIQAQLNLHGSSPATNADALHVMIGKKPTQ